MTDMEPDAAVTTTNTTNPGEIDLNTALEILSLRSSSAPSLQMSNDSNAIALQNKLNGISSQLGCGCCSNVHGLDNVSSPIQQQHPPGQLIDIGTTVMDFENISSSSSNNNNNNTADRNQTTEMSSSIMMNDSNTTASNEILDKQEHQKMAQQQAIARKEILISKIHSMSTNDTIAAIFHTQEERVKCYRFFDDGLEYVLETGNVEYYPLVCADVTASFTVLSATINAIRSDLLLRTSQGSAVRDVAELIQRLQRSEQTKLQLTAALHLEKMRCQAQQQQIETSSKSNEETNNNQMGEAKEGQQSREVQPDRILPLLKASINAMRSKIAVTIDEINDILEELRYAVIEENNDE